MQQHQTWATLAELKPDITVVVDSGFTCMPGWTRLSVERDDHGLYVPCSHGNHYLDGQENEDGQLG